MHLGWEGGAIVELGIELAYRAGAKFSAVRHAVGLVPHGPHFTCEKTALLEGPRVEVANTIPYERSMGTLRGVRGPSREGQLPAENFAFHFRTAHLRRWAVQLIKVIFATALRCTIAISSNNRRKLSKGRVPVLHTTNGKCITMP